MKYFRVFTDYTEFIPIDQGELEKALYAFITGSPVVFENGATTRIERIVPDYHREMGWPYGHKLSPDDWNEINDSGKALQYRGIVAKATDRVKFLIDARRTSEIGSGVDIPELAARNPLPGVSELAKKMTIGAGVRTDAQESTGRKGLRGRK